MKRSLLIVIICTVLCIGLYKGYSEIKKIDLSEAMRVMDRKADALEIPSGVEQKPGLAVEGKIAILNVIKSYDLDDTFYLKGLKVHLNKMQIVRDIDFPDSKTFKPKSKFGFVVLDAEIENTSDKDLSINDIDFTLITDKGKHKSYSYLLKQLMGFEPFSQGNLKAKEIRNGSIYLDYDGTAFDDDFANFTVAIKKEFYSYNIGNLSLRFKNQLGEVNTYIEEMDEME